ncbi:MAG: hypothetical protein E7563_02460 [Ruminococcaceae bacterium]|nr:hypothetical protein [Oscillospiraceae bacterium]
MLKDILDKKPHIQKHLFEKGYLITDTEIENTDEYPFYGNWTKTPVGSFYFWIYKGVNLFTCPSECGTVFLIGHAYNPYTMDYDENVILKKIAEAYHKQKHLDIINELTGVFIAGIVKSDGIEFLLDASGMQYGCYGTIEGKTYIASHMRLVGDICNLKTTPYVDRLINYKWYHFMMGNYLPGDITCYSELKRVIPNTYVTFSKGEYSVTRFYPSKNIQMCKTDEEYAQVIQEAARILHNNMKLIPMKWDNPSISLTGGIDSNTTFAATNGCYDKYTSFSYVAMDREAVDAQKAKEISTHFNVAHKTYNVPSNNEDIPDFDVYKLVFDYNQGDIGKSKDDDARKKITLIHSDVCDVEVKSWISETIRAYAYKYFGRKKFPKNLKARNYTSLYKIFFMNRKLVWETDKYFKEYFRNTQLKEHLYNYDESDFFVWELMHGGKCGLNIGVMKSCFDITIPYNNRNLLDLLLRVPLEYRISDKHHMDLKKLMNKELYDMNIRVVNLNETSARKKLANIYYTINSFLPF